MPADITHSLTHCQLTWLKVEGILQLIWKMERTQSFLPILSNTARVASSLASLTHSHTPSLRAARLSNTARVASSLASLTHSLTPSLRTVRCCRTLLGWRRPWPGRAPGGRSLAPSLAHSLPPAAARGTAPLGPGGRPA